MLPVDFVDWAGIFFTALCLKQFFALLTIFLVEKITWHESPTFADSNEVILKVFKQPFIKMDLQIRKSYKFCYEAKLNFLDWASCATPLKPGRKFSTYLAQSKLHFGYFIQNFHEFLLKP